MQQVSQQQAYQHPQQQQALLSSVSSTSGGVTPLLKQQAVPITALAGSFSQGKRESNLSLCLFLPAILSLDGAVLGRELYFCQNIFCLVDACDNFLEAL